MQKLVSFTGAAHGVGLTSVTPGSKLVPWLSWEETCYPIPFLLILLWIKNGSTVWTVHAAAARLRGLCSEDVLGPAAQH